MYKKTITVLLSALLVAQPMASHASSLSDAFSSLTKGTAVAVNKPGRYQSGARNSFSGGGLEIRAPRQNSAPQLFNFTPPSIQAGCGGISATFGGFSFISGDEFEDMLKQLASGAALGFVSMIAMKALCPQCEAVIQFLKTAAQQAARLSKDSCRFGQEMASRMLNGLGASGNEAPKNYCSETTTLKGDSGDYLGVAEAIGGMCQGMIQAVDTLMGENKNNKTKTPEETAQLSCQIQVGNVTWQRLNIFDGGKDEDSHKRKLLWLNLLGAQLQYAGESQSGQQNAACESPDGTIISPTKDHSGKTAICPPRLEPKDAMMLFMCGKPSKGLIAAGLSEEEAKLDVYEGIAQYCNQFFGSATDTEKKEPSPAEALAAKSVYYCASPDKTEVKTSAGCPVMKLGSFDKLVTGQGYLVSVMKALHGGVEAVRTNTPMKPETIALIQVAPFPLYQAINAAAVYPSATVDLLGGMGVMVAEQIAIGYLEDLLRMTGRTTAEQKASCLSETQASALIDAMSRSRAIARTVTNQIGKNIATQEAITAQIRQINLAIQKQVMSSEMLTSNIYSQGITGTLKANVPGTASTTPSK